MDFNEVKKPEIIAEKISETEYLDLVRLRWMLAIDGTEKNFIADKMIQDIDAVLDSWRKLNGFD